MTVKDAWIEEHYNAVVNSRLEIEGDKDLQKQGGSRRTPPVRAFHRV